MFSRYARRLRRVETNLRKERQMEGIAKAKAAGVYKGRPVSIDPAQVQQPKAEGMGPSQIAKQLGIASVWPEHGESHGYAAMVPLDGTQRTIPRFREHLRSLLMLFGLGRIQRGCLRVIEEYEAVGKRPTTVNIAAQVYRVRPNRLSEAQHVTTERALASLRQRGLVSGRQVVTVCPDGRKHFAHKQRLADAHTGPSGVASGHAMAAQTRKRLARWRQIERHSHLQTRGRTGMR
jgi:hypothetical protein